MQDEACNGSGRWSAASNLVSGDVLLMEDGKSVYVLEVWIEKLDEEINVYNLEVDEWHTYFVAGGVLVHNTYDTNGTSVDSGSSSVTYGELDSLGRTTGIEATITSDMIGAGSPAKSSIKPAGFGGQAKGHARGHLLGNQLGGSGSDPRNLVTIY